MMLRMPLATLNPDSAGLNSKGDLFSHTARGPGKGTRPDQLDQFLAIPSKIHFCLLIPSTSFVLSYHLPWSQMAATIPNLTSNKKKKQRGRKVAALSQVSR